MAEVCRRFKISRDTGRLSRLWSEGVAQAFDRAAAGSAVLAQATRQVFQNDGGRLDIDRGRFRPAPTLKADRPIMGDAIGPWPERPIRVIVFQNDLCLAKGVLKNVVGATVGVLHSRLMLHGLAAPLAKACRRRHQCRAAVLGLSNGGPGV